MRIRPYMDILAVATLLVTIPARSAGQAPARGELRLSSCAAEIAAPAECGTFTVWENRVARTGRTIDLNVVVLRASGMDALPDPVVFLTGGPGQDATSLARGLANDSMRRTRDILLVDQRGTGRSNGLPCAPEPGAPASAFMATMDTVLIHRCVRALSARADLRYYLTPYAMDDLDDLRAALGYDRVNLIGVSYGTRAALVYIRRHGEHVRSAMLQGSTAMSHPMPAGFARAAEDALHGVIEDCAADAACAKAFPKLPADYRKAVQTIEAGPREYAIRDPRSGSTATVQFTASDFAEALRAMLYVPATARPVPALLSHAASTGDYQQFAEFQLRRNIGLASGLAQGMYFAVTCTEDVDRTDAARAYAAGQGTFLADHRARAHIEGCRGWPRGELPAGFGNEVESAVPVLFITGQYDPATPPIDARTAASHLTNARVLIVPHGGHSAGGLTGGACLTRLQLAFLDSAAPARLDMGCLAGMRRPPFVTSPDRTGR